MPSFHLEKAEFLATQKIKKLRNPFFKNGNSLSSNVTLKGSKHYSIKIYNTFKPCDVRLIPSEVFPTIFSVFDKYQIKKMSVSWSRVVKLFLSF